MPDELNTNQNSEQSPVTPVQSPEQSVEQISVESTPNADKIQEISEFYQEKKATSESTAEPIIERSPIDYYLGAFRKYATFSGRATRSEFWYFQLFNIIANIVLLMIIDGIFGISEAYYLYIIACIIPSWALITRRLHDVGKSGWFLFIVFIPIIGALWLLILYATDSTPGANKYGPNPKGIES